MELRTCVPELPVRDQAVCVLLIPSEGKPIYARTLHEKRELLLSFDLEMKKVKGKGKNTKPILVAVWPGRLSSDAFLLTREDLSVVLLTEHEAREQERIRASCYRIPSPIGTS